MNTLPEYQRIPEHSMLMASLRANSKVSDLLTGAIERSRMTARVLRLKAAMRQSQLTTEVSSVAAATDRIFADAKAEPVGVLSEALQQLVHAVEAQRNGG